MKAKIYVTAWSWDLDKETGQPKAEASLAFWNTRPEPMKHQILVAEGEVTFELYEKINPTEQQIAAVEREICETRAELTAKITSLENERNNLLALPNGQKEG